MAHEDEDGRRKDVPMAATSTRPRGTPPRMRGDFKRERDANLYREYLRLRAAGDPAPVTAAAMLFGIARETASRAIHSIRPRIRQALERQFREELRLRREWARGELARAAGED